MELKVFTLRRCPKCPLARKIAQEVAETLGIRFTEVDMETTEGEIDGLMHQVMSTPSIAVDDEIIARGRVIPKGELENEIRKRLKK